MKKVRDDMTLGVEILEPGMSVQDAARKMKEYDYGFLPVVENGRVAGSLTDRDITLRVIAEGRDPARTLVRDVMSRDPAIVQDTDEFERACAVMKERRIRRVPVVDAQRRLVGMVTLARVAREQGEEVAGEILKDVIGPGP